MRTDPRNPAELAADAFGPGPKTSSSSSSGLWICRHPSCIVLSHRETDLDAVTVSLPTRTRSKKLNSASLTGSEDWTHTKHDLWSDTTCFSVFVFLYAPGARTCRCTMPLSGTASNTYPPFSILKLCTRLHGHQQPMHEDRSGRPAGITSIEGLRWSVLPSGVLK
jgi:hypothetical protein